MKKLYTKLQYNESSLNTLLPLKCNHCDKIFYKEKRYIKHYILKKNRHAKGLYCSNKCTTSSQVKAVNVICLNCEKEFSKKSSQLRKSSNHFCNRSCAAIYNNTHKTKGNRRSKIEYWLEKQLTTKYNQLHFDFNKKDIIDSELDIYIPSIKLAIELNGIFHYEPIYGQEKLTKIQKNDNKKFQICYEQNIELLIIDISKLRYFKLSNVLPYYEIITNVIDKKLIAAKE